MLSTDNLYAYEGLNYRPSKNSYIFTVWKMAKKVYPYLIVTNCIKMTAKTLDNSANFECYSSMLRHQLLQLASGGLKK